MFFFGFGVGFSIWFWLIFFLAPSLGIHLRGRMHLKTCQIYHLFRGRRLF